MLIQVYKNYGLGQQFKKIAVERGITLQIICNNAIKQYFSGGVTYNDPNS